MKKFFTIVILLVCLFSTKAFAEDVLLSVDDSDPIRTIEWYVQTEFIEEDFDTATFEVPLKLAIILKQVKINGSNDRTEHDKFLVQEFRFTEGVWYSRQKNSSHDFSLLNESEFDQKVFDACKSYCKLAQIYPR